MRPRPPTWTWIDVVQTVPSLDIFSKIGESEVATCDTTADISTRIEKVSFFQNGSEIYLDRAVNDIPWFGNLDGCGLSLDNAQGFNISLIRKMILTLPD